MKHNHAQYKQKQTQPWTTKTKANSTMHNINKSKP